MRAKGLCLARLIEQRRLAAYLCYREIGLQDLILVLCNANLSMKVPRWSCSAMYVLDPLSVPFMKHSH